MGFNDSCIGKIDLDLDNQVEVEVMRTSFWIRNIIQINATNFFSLKERNKSWLGTGVMLLQWH